MGIGVDAELLLSFLLQYWIKPSSCDAYDRQSDEPHLLPIFPLTASCCLSQPFSCHSRWHSLILHQALQHAAWLSARHRGQNGNSGISVVVSVVVLWLSNRTALYCQHGMVRIQ